MRKLLLTTALSLAAGAAAAEDIALILGNERYDRLDRVVQADDVVNGAVPLVRSGFAVFNGANGETREMLRQAQSYADEVRSAETQVIVLAGQFATDGSRTWFLGREASRPSALGVGLQGLSVDTLLGMLAATPGRSVLILGYDDGETSPYDLNLREGVGALDVPQGVTVIHGSAGRVADLINDVVAEPGADLMDEVRGNRRLSATGFVPAELVVLPAGRGTPGDGSAAAERAAWEAALAADTIEAYQEFLDEYRRGPFSQDARERIAAIASDPNRQARLAEEALNLTISDRRSVQRDLNILEFDTRGIDGIFGPGTRQAIQNWQQQNGFEQTAFLTSDQVARLDAQAERRARQLEQEAERRRQQAEAADRAFWEETGARGDEAGLRAYLDRYEDGLFSDRAEEQLEAIEEAQRQRAEARDRRAWDQAREENTLRAYNRYLNENPQGSFRDNAERRIATLQRDDNDRTGREEAQRIEERLRLDPLSLRLVEARLSQLGLEPGVVDGRIDDMTRRAIRRYQRDRNLDRTGYLDQTTVSRLLTDGFR